MKVVFYYIYALTLLHTTNTANLFPENEKNIFARDFVVLQTNEKMFFYD
jgi:hypothetical protein